MAENAEGLRQNGVMAGGAAYALPTGWVDGRLAQMVIATDITAPPRQRTRREAQAERNARRRPAASSPWGNGVRRRMNSTVCARKRLLAACSLAHPRRPACSEGLCRPHARPARRAGSKSSASKASCAATGTNHFPFQDVAGPSSPRRSSSRRSNSASATVRLTPY